MSTVECDSNNKTDPVVSAHGVEAIGAADKHQVVISGNQNFNKIVALILKSNTQHFIKSGTFLFS